MFELGVGHNRGQFRLNEGQLGAGRTNARVGKVLELQRDSWSFTGGVFGASGVMRRCDQPKTEPRGLF